jgi:hypothetical protein
MPILPFPSPVPDPSAPVCDLTGPYAYDLSVEVLWVPTIADTQAPTSTEIATGVSLLGSPYDLTDIIGWELESDRIDDNRWGPQVGQRLGQQAVSDAELRFTAGRDGIDVRALWSRGSSGNVVFLPSGPYLEHPTSPVQVFPVRVASVIQRQALRQPASILRALFAVQPGVGNNVLVAGP